MVKRKEKNRTFIELVVAIMLNSGAANVLETRTDRPVQPRTRPGTGPDNLV